VFIFRGFSPTGDGVVEVSFNGFSLSSSVVVGVGEAVVFVDLVNFKGSSPVGSSVEDVRVDEMV